MIRTHGDFENGDASSTRLAGEVFEKMDRMMDIIWYFERDL